MSNSNNPSSGGLGFAGALTICFIVLKVMDKIDWPWLWVLSPIWISVGVVFLLAFLLHLVNR